MAIEKYTTEGIILEAYDQGEHDRVYKIFTREYGLVMCHARGIRKLESKLRAHVMPRSVSLVTLVQGKEIWRLVGAEGRICTSSFIHEVTQLLARFVRGEGSHKGLYDRLIAFLSSQIQYDEQKMRLLLYYILFVDLGYADALVIGVKDLKEYVGMSVEDLYTRIILNYGTVRAHVLTVLEETQL
ncbi:MAG: hypothetical protein RLZZ308_563 [Candidatus Parcubacteria bacterium]|jgi:recombinational DNA repair protein (RecF pathway)